MPDNFSSDDYLDRTSGYDLRGGAIVSGSFQAFDQSYLIDALDHLGPEFVGVTQLPSSVTDEELQRLNQKDIRALRFNLKRGGSETIDNLDSMARRVHEVVGWHTELYIDSREIEPIFDILKSLPAVSIDHLGLSQEGLDTLIKLVENDVKVKATGFGRVDFDVTQALISLYDANPESLMFGTDLPSTRANRPYSDDDISMVIDALGEEASNRVFYQNAIDFYKPNQTRLDYANTLNMN